MRRKRVVIAHSWIEVSINVQTRQLAYELSKYYDVWFLSQARIGVKEIIENEHLTVLEWPNKRPTKFKDLFFCWKLFKTVKPDIVIAHFSSIKVGMMGAWLAGVKIRIAWYHTLSSQLKVAANNQFNKFWTLTRAKFAYFFASHIIALNEAGKKDAVAFLNKKDSAVNIIYNGISSFIPELRRKPDEKTVFLFLGRFDRSKGGDLIIKCFAKLIKDNPGISLQMVGYGRDENSWKQLVKDLQLEKCIDFPGRLTDYKKIFDFLSGGDVLLVPSRMDNFPTVVLEAFSCGVPVIGSRVGGIPEMIDDGVNGFLCDKDDEAEWINRMQLLIKDRLLRINMGVNAKNTYEERFTIDVHIKNVINYLSGF